MESQEESAITPEVEPPEIQKFSEEAKEFLLSHGYIIYQLTGQSVKSLRGLGMKFTSDSQDWEEEFPVFESLPSRISEVAIIPDTPLLFLMDSGNKSFDKQKEMVGEFSQKLSEDVKGVEAVIGEVPDYAELAFEHLNKTGEYLFGKDSHDISIRTNTSTGNYHTKIWFNNVLGFTVDHWNPENRDSWVLIAPLIVPANS